MIVQNVLWVMNGCMDFFFILLMNDGFMVVCVLIVVKDELGYEQILYNDQIGKVLVVGVGMRIYFGVILMFFCVLVDCGINLQMILIFEICILVVVDVDQVDEVVCVVYIVFGFDVEGEVVVYVGIGC